MNMHVVYFAPPSFFIGIYRFQVNTTKLIFYVASSRDRKLPIFLIFKVLVRGRGDIQGHKNDHIFIFFKNNPSQNAPAGMYRHAKYFFS